MIKSLFTLRCSLQVSRVFEPSPQIIPDSDWLEGGVLFHPQRSGVCVCVCAAVSTSSSCSWQNTKVPIFQKNFLKHEHFLLFIAGCLYKQDTAEQPVQLYTILICYQWRVWCKASRFFTSCVQFEFLLPFSVRRLGGCESLRGGGGFTLHLQTDHQPTNQRGRET